MSVSSRSVFLRAAVRSRLARTALCLKKALERFMPCESAAGELPKLLFSVMKRTSFPVSILLFILGGGFVVRRILSGKCLSAFRGCFPLSSLPCPQSVHH